VVLRKPSGTLIAYAWNQVPADDNPHGPVYLHGGCHPAWRHEGVQPTLLDWQTERALEWYLDNEDDRGPLEVVMVTSTANHIFADLLPTRGYPPQKWYHAMRRSLLEPLPGGPETLPGVHLERFGPEWKEPVRLLYNANASDPADTVDEEAWAWGLSGAGVRDDWSWVAVANDRGARSDTDRLPDSRAYSLAEIDWIARNETVVHLADIVMRRTTLAIAGSLTARDLDVISAVAAEALGWDVATRAREVASVTSELAGKHRMRLGTGIDRG